MAGLRLLNNLPLPDYVHPQLRRVMPALMEILQSDYILSQVPGACGQGLALPPSPTQSRTSGFPAQGQTHLPSAAFLPLQVQVVRLLSHLAQKNDLLYDILNCQVRKGDLQRGWGVSAQVSGREEGWLHC